LWDVSRIIYGQCFDFFDYISDENTLEVYMRITFTRYIIESKRKEIYHALILSIVL